MTDDERAERRRPRGAAKLTDLTMIVRTGRPAGVRAFTDAEADEAQRYAAEHGSIVEPLGGIR